MKVQVKIFEAGNNMTYDISKAVSDLTITTYLYDNPGKLELTVYDKSPLIYHMGSAISVKVDGYKMFKGFLFTAKNTDSAYLTKMTAYDQMRYLKNKEFRVFENLTSDQIFTQLCKSFALKYKVIDKSNYICPPRCEDATSLYDMIQHSLDATLAFSNQWFYIRDNYGVLEHRNVLSDIREETLGDNSYMTSWEIENTIDSDVYTQIKLYRDNQDTGKRDVYILSANSDYQKRRLIRYGILQLYEKVDEKLTDQQIVERARMLQKRYSPVKRSMTIKSIGIKEFHAGSIFRLKMKKVTRHMWLDNYVIATQCTHKFSGNTHKMEIQTLGLESVK